MNRTNYKVVKADGSSNGVFASKETAKKWAESIRAIGHPRPKVVETDKPVNAHGK